MRRIVLIGGCVLGLGGGLYGQTGSRPAGTASMPAVATTAALARALAPATAADAKAYVHPGTKMKFPEKLQEFTRVEVVKYAADESDVGVGYNFDEGRGLQIVATVYVFPAPTVARVGSETVDEMKKRQIQNALDAVKKEISSHHADAKTISEAEFVLKEGERSHKGVKVTYEMSFTFGSQSVTATSDMFLFVEGAWQIEYRISYRKTSAEIAQPYVEMLMGDLKWGN